MCIKSCLSSVYIPQLYYTFTINRKEKINFFANIFLEFSLWQCWWCLGYCTLRVYQDTFMTVPREVWTDTLQQNCSKHVFISPDCLSDIWQCQEKFEQIHYSRTVVNMCLSPLIVWHFVLIYVNHIVFILFFLPKYFTTKSSF